MLLVLAIVLLLAMPEPEGLIAFTVVALLGLGEIVFWHHAAQHYRRVVGPQAMFGRQAVVVSACHPLGQVRIDGEIWSARCEDGASPGETVRIFGRRRLCLLVTRVR